MQPRYLLDTDICSYLHGVEVPAIRRRFERLKPGEAVISAITWGELQFGVQRSRNRGRVQRLLDELRSLLPVLPVTREVAEAYGRVRADLEVRGALIGANDLWIAAQACATRLTLVTNHQREFHRVSGLRLENWVDAGRD